MRLTIKRIALILGWGACGVTLMGGGFARAQMPVKTVPATPGAALPGAAGPGQAARPAGAPMNAPAAKPAPMPVLPDETVILRVNGQPVTQKEINKMVNQMMMRYLSSQPGNAAAQLPTGEILRKRAELRAQARQRLTDTLLLDRASRPELDKVTTATIEARYKQMSDTMAKQGYKLEEALARAKRSPDDLRQDIRKEQATVALLEQKYGSLAPTEDELRQAFEKDKDRFKQPAQVHLSEIVLFYSGDPKKPKPAQVTPEQKAELKTKAEALLARIKKGEDFAAVAKEASQAPNADKGGDLGWHDSAKMLKAYADTVAKLKPGEVGGPVQTDWGFHVVKLIEQREARPGTFEEAHDRLREEGQAQNMQRRTEQLLTELKPQAKIEDLVPDPELPPAPPLAPVAAPTSLAAKPQAATAPTTGSK